MLAELRGVHAAVPLEGGGRWVAFLPSAHVADRWGSHYSALMTYGHTVTCVADPTQVMAAVAQAKPTVFGGVPRVWEKLKAALEASGAAALPPEQLRARLGLDEARWLAVGAAPTPVEVLEFFDALGLPICEVWGMSEMSCIVTTNRPGRANAHLSRVEQIKRFRILATEWLPGGGQLTPTMKLKRRPIAEKYAAEIESIYDA